MNNTKFITSKSIAYTDLTPQDCNKSYPNIFSTLVKQTSGWIPSLLCIYTCFYIFEAKVMNFVLLQNIYNTDRTRWETFNHISLYQCEIPKISTPLWKRTRKLCIAKFLMSESELLQRWNKSASLSAGISQHWSINFEESVVSSWKDIRHWAVPCLW